MIRLLEPELERDSLEHEISESNERCRYLKREIVRALKRPRDESDSLQPFVQILEAYRDQLALHFALEFASEMFRKAIERAPRLYPKLGSVLTEQENLYSEFCEIAELLFRYADLGVQRIPRAVIHRWKQFDLRLRRHDIAACELIYDAYFVDIGGGD